MNEKIVENNMEIGEKDYLNESTTMFVCKISTSDLNVYFRCYTSVRGKCTVL